ncbi:hypothetical protein GDI1370 [Gluconacetobacter diazotrophicus PA1 5]|uniref:Uncharacterized protein n=1 Tax=Gluconacetobacter diazotrophicus (strain ATCC 49037 / DSM 5601 / CCUG 37298 / CIP 103539 / LMG 7603 / PAl5) TaxID=272568 RepID=A9HF32_GLUDA|nr:hypothetical protein GDI1370 [Gluconacetobacter diazotrophicus PA1 5]
MIAPVRPAGGVARPPRTGWTATPAAQSWAGQHAAAMSVETSGPGRSVSGHMVY